MDKIGYILRQARFSYLFGATLLLVGSCIGVGMLALPVLTCFAGFWPTCATFVGCLIFMIATALLLVEANLWFPATDNIISISEKILGKKGKYFAWGVFLFLFYSLLVAYITKGGELVQQGMEKAFPFPISKIVGKFIITISTGFFVYYGTRAVDFFNRLCMFGLIFAYCFLISTGVEISDYSALDHKNWSYVPFVLPFIVTSFGFHNMISSLSEYVGGDRRNLIIVILFGGIISFVIYVLWVLKIHISIPLEGAVSLKVSYAKGEIATEPLVLLVQNPLTILAAQFLAFFAVITSLLGQSLSIMDFLKDGLKLNSKILLLGITFVPPLVFSLLFPNIFFVALELAGGVATMSLFGILPCWIIWKGRYSLGYNTKSILPGGKIVLSLILIISGSIVLFEIAKAFSSLFHL